MRHRIVLISLLSVSLMTFPAAAQDRFIDINAFATWVDSSGDSALRLGDNIDDVGDIDFESDQGFGASVNVFWSNRISTEFAMSVIDPDLNVNSPSRGRIVFTEPLEMMPITAVLQLHLLGSSRFDPYVGVGGGYILFEDIEDRNDLDDIDFERIDFEDDIGLVLNAGFRLGLTENFGIYLDGKYMPLETAATPVFTDGPDEEVDIAINPLILAAGISFSF
jgi:outer membrane protein W